MSAIPPGVIGSVLQSGTAAGQAARADEAARNESDTAARRLHKPVNDIVELEIEATDADTRVHADGGGLGSQGRHDAPPEQQDDETRHDDQKPPPPGRLDVTA